MFSASISISSSSSSAPPAPAPLRPHTTTSPTPSSSSSHSSAALPWSSSSLESGVPLASPSRLPPIPPSHPPASPLIAPATLPPHPPPAPIAIRASPKPVRRRPAPRAFTRAFGWSLRMSAAVVVAGAISSINAVRDEVEAPFLIPVFAVIVVNASLGQTLRFAVVGTAGTLLGCAAALLSQLVPLALLAHRSPALPYLLFVVYTATLILVTFGLRDATLAVTALVPTIALSLPTINAATPPEVFPLESAARLAASIVAGIVVGVLASIPLPRLDAALLDDGLVAMTQTASSLIEALVNIVVVRATAGERPSSVRFRANIELEHARALFLLFDSQAEQARNHHSWLTWDPSIFAYPRSAARIAAYGRLIDAFHSLDLATRCLRAAVKPEPAKPAYLAAFAPYVIPPLQTLAAELRSFATSLPLSWGRASSSMLSEVSHWTLRTRVEPLDATPLVEALAHARAEIFYTENTFDVALASTEDMLNLQVLIKTMAVLVDRLNELSQAFDDDAHDSDDSTTRAPGSGPSTRAWLWRVLIGPGSYKARAVFSLRRALAVAAASLVVVIPSATATFGSNGVWAPLSVAFIMTSPEVGTSLRRAVLRLEGTVVGAMFAYYVLVLCGGFKGAVVALIGAFVFAAGFARAAPSWSYAGLVAAFTAPIIAFGNDDANVSDKEYALQRILQTGVGISVATFASVVLPGPWIRPRLYAAFAGAITALVPAVESVTRGSIPECAIAHGERGVAPVALSKRLDPVWAGIAKQDALTSLARLEPSLWRPPVPAGKWELVIRAQRRLVHAVRWLGALAPAGDVGFVPPHADVRERYLGELDEQLQSVCDVVVRSLNKLVRDAKLAGDVGAAIEFDTATAELTSFLAQTPLKLRVAYESALHRHVTDAHSRSTVRAELDTALVMRLSTVLFGLGQISSALRFLWKAVLDLEYAQRLQGW